MDDLTTKQKSNATLKETYGGKVAVQPNRRTPADALDQMRFCPTCGKKRMGQYCRECGVATMPRNRKRGANQPQTPKEVKKEIRSGADTSQDSSPR